MLTLVFLFFVLYGARWAYNDWRRPYSCAEAAGNYLVDHRLEQSTIAGNSDFGTSTVAAYIDRQFYFPASGKFGMWVEPTTSRRWPISDKELCSDIDSLRSTARRPAILLLTYPLADLPRDGIGVRFLGAFTGAMQTQENYWIYEITYRDKHTP